MRPLVFVLGLALVATVLIVRVDAIKCYLAEGNNAHQKVNCNGGVQYPGGAYSNGKCYKYDGSKYPKECGVEADVCDVQGFHCCNETDYCNGDNNGAVTSTPPGPLLVAVITGVIAAVGI